MANYLLKPVFKTIFNKDFRPDLFEDRLEMQKAIYLLQNMGISVGDYKFMWYKHGPYSQTLQNDILSMQNMENICVSFSSDAKSEMESLRQAILKERSQYNDCDWIECLGSLHYIKENLLPSSADEESILRELKNRKAHLDKDEDNRLALQTLEELAV